MLAILSPSKNVNFNPQSILTTYSMPEFSELSRVVMDELRKLSVQDIIKLMKVNPSIASLNFQRYRSWQLPFTPENAKQSVLAFDGEVYRGVKAHTFTPDDFDFAQDHLRILSGLYGLLRPLDLIQPYRLEMGIPLVTPKAKNMYTFWGDRIALKLNELFHQQKGDVLINLASAEYFKAIRKNLLKFPVISVEFWEARGGDYKTIVIYTKKARGMMVRFIIRNRLSDPKDLKGFDEEGYVYNPRFSKEDRWVFTRN